MRNTPYNPIDQIVRHTARVLNGPLSPSMGNEPGATFLSNVLPTSGTDEGVDGDGLIYTIHSGFTELDSTNTQGVYTGSG